MTPEEMLSHVSVIFRLPEKVVAEKAESVKNVPMAEVMRWLIESGPVATSMGWSIDKTVERLVYLRKFNKDPGVLLHRRIVFGEEAA